MTRACLIRPASTTHGFDQSQRYVPLRFVAETASPARLFVTVPATSDSLPPGDYLLFLTGSSDGPDVPSIARWLRVNAPGGPDLCDAVAPARIVDLAATCDPDNPPYGFILSWTAPADDTLLAASGRAVKYWLKKRASQINESNWGSSTHVDSAQACATVGTAETRTVAVGQPTYFALRAKDDNGQWALVSNSVGMAPLDEYDECIPGGGLLAGGEEGGGGSSLQRAAGPASLTGSPVIGENTLLPGVRNGTRASDRLRLPAMAGGSQTYPVRMRTTVGRAAVLDRVSLLAVDHGGTVRAFPAGSRVVLGERVAPLSASDAAGANVTSQIDGGGSGPFVGDSGTILTVRLRAESGDPVPLVIEASTRRPTAGGIVVEAADGAGDLRALAQVHPRFEFAELAVDSVAAAEVRLVFLGTHSVRFVGSVEPAAETPQLHWGELTSAVGSRSGDDRALVAATDSASLTLTGPDTLRLVYALPALPDGQVRECFLAVEATPIGVSYVGPASMAPASSERPTRFALHQNQPNPFGPSTTIRFDLPVGAIVRLELFDVQGRRVRTLVNHYLRPGRQTVDWDGLDGRGSAVRPAGPFRDRRKMIRLP